MTSEHVTITEEVQSKDGVLVTQERETLQYTADPAVVAGGNAAMGVTHPDFVPASERVYVYNEATGMSDSAPAVDTPAGEEAGPHELTVAELRAYAAEHDVNLQGATVKADIKGHILNGMTVGQLRDFAALEGTDLGDATKKADIYDLVLAGPIEAEPVDVVPAVEEETDEDEDLDDEEEAEDDANDADVEEVEEDDEAPAAPSSGFLGFGSSQPQ